MAKQHEQSGKGQNVTPPAATATGKKTRVSTVDPNETKRAKFIRLGGIRVGKALKAIQVIGNLSGSGYEYTPADVEKIRDALDRECKSALAKFSAAPGAKKATNLFAL